MAQRKVCGMHTAIYLRKSRADLEDESRGHSDTLSRHQTTLLALAERLGLIVGQIYPEVVSGETIASRPQMQRLLHDLEQGLWDAVMVMEVARLTRGSQIDQGIIANAFKYTHTLIITPDKIYDPFDSADEDMLDFGMFFSRFEWKAINKRQQAGRRASSREGKYTGSVAPYGYLRQKLSGEKGWTLVPDPETAPIVQRVFRLLTQEHISQHAIAVQLNTEGIPAPRGGTWTSAAIQRLLRNPHYAGYITAAYRPRIKSMKNGKVIQSRPINPNAQQYAGRHTPLVPPEQFADAARLLAQNRRPPAPHISGLHNPLSGLVLCSVCGKHMQRRNMSSGKAQLVCPTRGCPTVAANLDEVTCLLVGGLSRWLPQLSVSLGGQSERQAQHRELETLTRRLARLQAQQARIFELVETGVYSSEDFCARRQVLQDEYMALIRTQTALQKSLCVQTSPEQERRVVDILQDTQSSLLQNQLFKALVDHVLYTKTIRSTRAHHKTDLSLEIFPRFLCR